MVLMSVGWTLSKPLSRWRTKDLDILLNGDLLFKRITKLRYLSIDDMPNIVKITQPAITCSKLTIEILEQGLKYV